MFQRAPGGEVVGEVETDVYVVDADGSESDVELLFAGGGAGRWSPDGSEVSVFCCDDGMVAHLVDVATGDVRGLETPDPTLELYCDFGWSPDGERLVCEGYGVDDPSRNGIYSIRASDGGDLTRITSNPDGEDIPGDYSPDGTRLVFMRFEDDVPTGLFVVDIADDGAGEGEPQQLTPEGMVLDDSGHAGRWSPDGDEILFVARESEDHHKAIWVVNAGADGGAPSSCRSPRAAAVRWVRRTRTAATRRTGRQTATRSSSPARSRTARTRASGSSTPTEAASSKSPTAPTTTRLGERHRRQREPRAHRQPESAVAECAAA